ncbi:MAG: DUF262 domain-containing protein [Candidatus Paceibacterota bacterium]|jgi:uncharacterized protein with ParB-like and HNH nuclease domain
MNIESKDFKIGNIFSRRKYIIPDYQRNYSWTVDTEISIFWDDFIYYLNKTGPNFFIGPMVYKAQSINSSEFEVIDGQQRLITFSILLSVIVSLFRKYSREDLADGLKQYLIYKDEKNRDQLVIETIEPHPFFQSKIFHQKNAKPTKESEKLIEKARIFFDENIEVLLDKITNPKKKVEFLEKMREYVFNIDTVIIVSADETDAFTIFETINTRGKNLTSLDLLKNYIFKNHPKLVGVQEPKMTWKELMENIEIGKDTFFNRFWASWVSKITENKLYRRFSDHMRDLEANKDFPNAKILLDELLVASKIYKKITKPSLDDWKVNKNYHVYHHIKNINGLFSLKVHFPFFLSLFEEFEKKKISLTLFNKTLFFLENFHFIFTHMVSPRASGLDNKYSKFAIRLRKEKNKAKVINDLRKELIEKIPKKEEYIERFKELNFIDHRDTIMFILLRLEKVEDKSLTLDFDLNSIEHLDPKSTKTLLNNSIGNLFLLEEKYNHEKDNLKPFDLWPTTSEKVISFLGKNTKYKTTKKEFQEILKDGKWGNDEIAKRTERLARETYILFSKL